MRAVIEPFAQQVVAQCDDQLDCGLRQPGWAGARAARPRLKRFLAFPAVTGHQLADPALRDPIFASHLGLAAALDDNGGDD
jgi:hypothetical protein